MEHDRHGCHVVMGECPIASFLMDWQPLVKHDHRDEMGMGQYPQTGLGCCSSYRHVVVGKRVIPRVLMDWQPLVKHDHRHEMGMGQYPAPGVHCGSYNRDRKSTRLNSSHVASSYADISTEKQTSHPSCRPHI